MNKIIERKIIMLIKRKIENKKVQMMKVRNHLNGMKLVVMKMKIL
jgi:hypothetical protein